MNVSKNRLSFMVFAIILVFVLFITPSLALQSKNEYANQEISLTTIEESLDDDVETLDVTYLAYLKENGIEVVNGDIKVETVEQFVAIKDYYKKYFTDNNYFYETYADNYRNDDKYIALNIFTINFYNLPDNLKKELLEKKIVEIDDEFRDMCEHFSYRNALYGYYQLTDGKEGVIDMTPIIFDNQIRKTSFMINSDLKYMSSKLRINDLGVIDEIGNKYLEYLYDDGQNYQPNYLSMNDFNRLFVIYQIIPINELLGEHQYQYAPYINALIYGKDMDTYKFLDSLKQEMIDLNKSSQ